MLVALTGTGAGSTNAPQAFWMARGVISPCPSAVNKSSSCLKPSFSHKCCWLGLGLILLMIFSSWFLPLSRTVSAFWARIYARILLIALDDFTQPSYSQFTEGCPSLAAMISTRCPFSSGVDSGTICPSTFAPRQRSPKLLCKA